MAPRGSKRAAGKVDDEPGAKRIDAFLKQQGVSRASFQPALEIVQHPLSGLPNVVRDMLVAMLPWSVTVRRSERHEVQATAVRMVEDVAEVIEATLQEAVDVAAARVTEVESARAGFAADLQRAEAAEAEALKIEDDSRGHSSEADAMLSQKEKVLLDATQEEKRLAAGLEQMRTQKARLEEVLSGSFSRLKDRSCGEGEVESSVKTVLSAVAELSLDESLVMALPAVLAKRDHGAFDSVVMNEAEQAFQSKLASWSERIEAACATVHAQATAVQTAQSDFDGAVAAQAQAASAFRSAQEATVGATGAAKAAKARVLEFEPQLISAAAAKGEKIAELEQFRDYHVAMFQMLRDRAPSEKKEEPAERRPSAEVAGESAAADISRMEPSEAGC